MYLGAKQLHNVSYRHICSNVLWKSLNNLTAVTSEKSHNKSSVLLTFCSHLWRNELAIQIAQLQLLHRHDKAWWNICSQCAATSDIWPLHIILCLENQNWWQTNLDWRVTEELHISHDVPDQIRPDVWYFLIWTISSRSTQQTNTWSLSSS